MDLALREGYIPNLCECDLSLSLDVMLVIISNYYHDLRLLSKL